MRRFGPITAGLVILFLSTVPLSSQGVKPETWTPDIPSALRGPFIVDPATLTELDKPGSDCGSAGPLNFQCMVFHDDRSGATAANLASNPFALPVFERVRSTIRQDLRSIAKRSEYGGTQAQKLSEGFLDFAGAQIELVGVINRMDRQFNRDDVPAHGKKLACGEISAVYRFGYQSGISGIAAGDQIYRSRLPVTMNVVFPAVPWSGELKCSEVAKRWLDYVEAARTDVTATASRAQARVLVSSLKPGDVDRIELNLQGSRVPAASDETDFGTLATYIIRVFRWQSQPGGGRWMPSYLTNQIDRARLLGLPGDENTCVDRWGIKLDRKRLAAYLLSMNPVGKGDNAFGDVDNGLVNIPQEFLACRAVSISPGGASRSGNQPFWNATADGEQILSNSAIEAALKRYRTLYPSSLGFVGSAEEFRTRLNEASCSGCHQTRAIAGFHFPGADRPGTSSVNAVFLPGSPHFFGDQPRRMEILRSIAQDKKLSWRELAMSYAARPLNRFAQLKPSADPSVKLNQSIQLVGGWGGACLTGARHGGLRQWDCAQGLSCVSLFKSSAQPGAGICVNAEQGPQIGEAMQVGQVEAKRFGEDRYRRSAPAIPPRPSGEQRDTTISVAMLTAPANNSFVASHQEYYKGRGGVDALPGETDEEHARRVREQETGGFPGGALRLAECANLPSEATCGLLASSGFNACLSEAGEGKRTADSCFGIYTSYSGVRACGPATPCRDDYICMNPLGYTLATADALFSARAQRRAAARTSPAESEINKKRLGVNFFGERMPDQAWLLRNNGHGDRRGLCIPPYFVFQFKADGHRLPIGP